MFGKKEKQQKNSVDTETVGTSEAVLAETPQIVADNIALSYYKEPSTGNYFMVKVMYDTKTLGVERIERVDMKTNLRDEAITKFKVEVAQNEFV